MEKGAWKEANLLIEAMTEGIVLTTYEDHFLHA